MNVMAGMVSPEMNWASKFYLVENGERTQGISGFADSLAVAA